MRATTFEVYFFSILGFLVAIFSLYIAIYSIRTLKRFIDCPPWDCHNIKAGFVQLKLLLCFGVPFIFGLCKLRLVTRMMEFHFIYPDVLLWLIIDFSYNVIAYLTVNTYSKHIDSLNVHGTLSSCDAKIEKYMDNFRKALLDLNITNKEQIKTIEDYIKRGDYAN